LWRNAAPSKKSKYGFNSPIKRSQQQKENMKNKAIILLLLSFLFVSCGDDSGSSASDSGEETERSSSSSEKANKSSKSSSSSSKKTETVTEDIQNWKDTTEGAIRKGDITDTIYIFENKKWRVATLPEASLGLCNEKTVGNFGFVEKHKMQDMIYQNMIFYYTCIETYGNKFHWDGIDSVSFFKTICNHSNDSANSNNGNAHWGSVIPVKKKCANCKQKDIDLFEDRCNKRCYFGTMVHASACALGFGGCTKDLYGTMKEGPAIKTGRNSDYVGDESYVYDSYLISIDSTKKATYICRNQYTYEEPNEPSYGWYVASDIDIDAFPTICTWDIEGQIVVGKKNTYACQAERFRLATQEEIEAGFACTTELIYQEKCEVNEKE
jgi:hypothetical protein